MDSVNIFARNKVRASDFLDPYLDNSLRDLILRLLVMAYGIRGDLPLDSFILRPLIGGRSVARVFMASFALSAGCKGSTPVVLKLGPFEEIKREKSNYDRFARPGLADAVKPEMLGFARVGTQAGICYSLLGRPERDTETLTRRLQQRDINAIDLVLRTVFDPLRDSWYAPREIRKERDLAARYLKRYFTGRQGPKETETVFQFCLRRYFNGRCTGSAYALGGESFPILHDRLFCEDRPRSYLSCILHGDLNTDNIVVLKPLRQAALIDFRKTGRGHVLEDLIALEASIRINYPPNMQFEGILEQERSIALGRPAIDPYAASIQMIRDRVVTYFGMSEMSANYSFALAAIGLRLMQAVDLTHVARARIVASALWAVKNLESAASIRRAAVG